MLLRDLLAGAREADPRIEYDGQGNAPRWHENVFHAVLHEEVTNDSARSRSVWSILLGAGEFRGMGRMRQHREETLELADAVADASVRLIPMSYVQLREEWERVEPPTHLPFLRMRYGRSA